jgi:uncharacterized lipoprotein
MKSERQIRYAFLLIGVLIVLMLAPSSSSGQVISDQNMGPSSEAPLNEGVIVMPQETLPKELDQRFERSMQAPEGSSETADHLVIRTPDQQDLENARESDLKSAVTQ